MIEIEYKEKDKVDCLYNKIKNIILSKKTNKNFHYNYKQHHLYEESECPGISKNYYNESGTVEFENINGEIIRLEICRWHPHKHNGCSGLNGNPCLTAAIYIIVAQEKQLLWELSVKSGTLYYKAEVSNLEIPIDILKEEPLASVQENDVDEMMENNDPKSQIDNQETRILFDEIVNLYNKYKSAKQSKEELLSKRKKEIDEATEAIMKFYSEKLTQNDQYVASVKKELNIFDKLFEKYSTFDIDLVGRAIQQLISIVEGEEYLYKRVNHKLKKRVHGVIDSWDEDVQTFANIIIIADKYMECYESSSQTKTKINKLIDQGCALLLSEQDINIKNDKKITFYTSQDGQILCHIDFGRFDYIKEFIDSIVQYRFQNDIVEFTEKDMLLFMKNFIIGYKDTIMEILGSRINEKILSLRLDIS